MELPHMAQLGREPPADAPTTGADAATDQPHTSEPAMTQTGPTIEQAVMLPGQKKFHRLQPDAIIGTLRCGAGFHRTSDRETRWKPVAEVVESRRCKVCWKRADMEAWDAYVDAVGRANA